MSDGRWRKPPAKGPPQSKAERRSETEDIVAAFLAKGGSVTRVAGAEPTAFACGTCGHAGIAAFTPGKSRKCPKCRSLLT